jgi:ABC-type sugar transport system ATPase subunit
MTTHPAYATTSGLNDWARKLLSLPLDALLATANPDGSPHTVPVGFAFDGQRFLIASGSTTRKARNLEADPRARVLVMDEPTAALSGVEAERLFAVARTLRDAGSALLFISHRFDEVFSLSDRVTVVRDGAFVSCDPTADLDVDTVVRRMVGREVTSLYPKEEAEHGDTVLEVEGLTRTGVFADVSFSVRTGEIVALAGLVGAGRSEVVRAVFGVDRYDGGSAASGVLDRL